MTAWLIAVAGGLLGVLMALIEGRRQGRKSEAARRNAEAHKRQAEAETKRRGIEDEIEQDTDLADRARRAGLVRPER